MSARRVNAQKIAADIKSRLTYERLMDRYSLSEDSLDSVFQQLVSSGLVGQEDLPAKDHAICSTQAASPGCADDVTVDGSWECLACGAIRTSRSGACPTCGMKAPTMQSDGLRQIEFVDGPAPDRVDSAEYMSAEDRAVESEFIAWSDGQKIFVPWSQFCLRNYPGYVVPSEKEYLRLQRAEWYWVTICTSLTLAIWRWCLDHMDSIWMACLICLIFLALYQGCHFFWLRARCRRLKQTKETF